MSIKQLIKIFISPINIIINIYLFLLFGIYPLFIRKGYVDIDLAKRDFLWSITIFFFLASIICIFIQLFDVTKSLSFQQNSSITGKIVYYFAILLLISAFCSSFRKEALYGQPGWFMGCIIGLGMCIVYYIITNFWICSDIPIIVLLSSSSFVFLLGILNRFGLCIFPSNDQYLYSFISTLGNIGWYNGFIAIISPLGIVPLIVSSQTFSKRALLYLYSFLVFTTCLSQGGDSIIFYFLMLFSFTFTISLYYENGFKRWLELIIIWAFSSQFIHLYRIVFFKIYRAEDKNGGVCNLLNNTFFTVWILLIALVLYFIISRNPIYIIKANCYIPIITSFVIILAITSLIIISVIKYGESWGNGRGASINTGLMIISNMPILKKLFGVGPDCFASYGYSISSISNYIVQYYGDVTLTNAHCELLTSIVNIGLIGTIAFYGIIFSFLIRCCRYYQYEPRLICISACLVCYISYNMINYAQILNYPFLFILLAIGESYMKATITLS